MPVSLLNDGERDSAPHRSGGWSTLSPLASAGITGRTTDDGWAASCRMVWVATFVVALAPNGSPVLGLGTWGKFPCAGSMRVTPVVIHPVDGPAAH